MPPLVELESGTAGSQEVEFVEVVDAADVSVVLLVLPVLDPELVVIGVTLEWELEELEAIALGEETTS